MSPQRVLTRRERIRNRVAAILALIVVWNLLWGEFTWANIITGAVVSSAALVFFPLPPVTFSGRLRPIGLLRFGIRFAWDLLIASVQVAAIAFRPGPPPTSAIVAVPLRLKSDLNLTLVAEAVSLIPGSLIVEADRDTATLYIHMLGVDSAEHVERLRKDVLLLEARLARAVGSSAEFEKLCGPDASHRKETQP